MDEGVKISALEEKSFSDLQGLGVIPVSIPDLGTFKVKLSEIGALNTPHIHIQEIPKDVWTINHNRDTLEPNVVVYNSQGRQGFAQVDIVDRDNLTITFGAAEYGRAKVS